MTDSTKQLVQFPATVSVAAGDLVYSSNATTGIEQRTTVAQLQTFILAPIALSNSTDAGALTGVETMPVSRGNGLLQTTSGAMAKLVMSTLAPQRQTIPVTSAGQATYVTNGYTVGLLNIFIAGIRVTPSSYTANDGVNFVITNAKILSRLVPGMSIDVEAAISQAVSTGGTVAPISSLPTAATLTGAELLSVMQGAGLVQTTLARIAAYVGAGAAAVFGFSGPNHAAGLVPDPGATAGTSRFLSEAGWALPPTATAGNVMGAAGSGHAAGYAPDPGAVQAAIRFLREDATWVAAARQTSLNLLDFLTVNGATVTDDIALTNAFAAMTAQNKNLYIPRGGTSTVDGHPAYKITTANKIWNIDAGDVYCEPGVVFDVTALAKPSGWAVRVGPVLAVSPNFFVKAQGAAASASDYTLASKAKTWIGGQVRGNSIQGVAGMLIGSNLTDGVAYGTRVTIKDMFYSTLDIGILTGSNCYLCNFYNNSFGGCSTVAYFLGATIDAFQSVNLGENWQIFGGSIYNGSAIGIQASACDVWVNGLSFDYNNSVYVQTWYDASVTVNGGHIEWNSTTNSFFQHMVSDGTTGNTITVRDVWFIYTGGGAMTAYLAKATDAGSYITFERCTYHNLVYGSTYTAGTTWGSGSGFAADSTPTITTPTLGGARITTTATLVGTTTAGTTTFSLNEGNWIVRESMCKFTFSVAWTAATGTGNMQFSMAGGMPKSVATGDRAVTVRAVNLTLTSGNLLQARVLAGTANIRLDQVTPAGVSTDLAMKTAGTVQISGEYPC